MRVVLPASASHTIAVVPRYYGFVGAVLTLTSLVKDVDAVVAHTENLVDGVLEISFDYDFDEGDRFTVKLMEADEVVWRGEIFATAQDVQNFDVSKNYYSYG